jgi:hypothetical protein
LSFFNIAVFCKLSVMAGLVHHATHTGCASYVLSLICMLQLHLSSSADCGPASAISVLRSSLYGLVCTINLLVYLVCACGRP